MLVARRRRMLAWLRSADFQAYSLCISQLGLNDVFGKQVLLLLTKQLLAMHRSEWRSAQLCAECMTACDSW
jgi:hypothetical protein